MQEQSQKIERAYALAQTASQPEPPKRALFGYKCPKCGGKLKKEDLKMLIVAGEQGTTFADTVARDNELGVGAYNLAVSQFKCDCGYEFARSVVDPVNE